MNPSSGIILCAPVALFIWEHIARKAKSNIKPSVAIAKLANTSVRFFSAIGRFAAMVSSFYTYVDLMDLKQTAKELVMPTVRLVESPLFDAVAYVRYAITTRKPILIILGSLSLGGLAFVAQRHSRFAIL